MKETNQPKWRIDLLHLYWRVLWRIVWAAGNAARSTKRPKHKPKYSEILTPKLSRRFQPDSSCWSNSDSDIDFADWNWSWTSAARARTNRDESGMKMAAQESGTWWNWAKTEPILLVSKSKSVKELEKRKTESTRNIIKKKKKKKVMK